MQVLVVGGQLSHTDAHSSHDAFGRGLGRAIAERGHGLLVCSEHEKSLDRQVLEGFATLARGQGGGRVAGYYPKDTRLLTQLGREVRLDLRWERLKVELGLRDMRLEACDAPELVNGEGWTFGVLRCQLKALEAADVVVSLGGSTTGSAMMLLHVAHGLRKPVVPVPFLGGASRRMYDQLNLATRVPDRSEAVLRLQDPAAEPADCLDIAQSLCGFDLSTEGLVFLSYPWARADVADQVEATLLRLAMPLFRDSRNIEAGELITPEVEAAIDRCSLFLALWCKEYVASPHCYDEMARVMRRRDDPAATAPPRVVMLLLDGTRAVWPAVRGASPLEFGARCYPVHTGGSTDRRLVESHVRDLFRGPR